MPQAENVIFSPIETQVNFIVHSQNEQKRYAPQPIRNPNIQNLPLTTVPFIFFYMLCVKTFLTRPFALLKKWALEDV